MAPSQGSTSSATPTRRPIFQHARSMSNQGIGDAYGGKEELYPPGQIGRDGRSHSNSSIAFGPRNSSLAQPGQQPGSFSSDLKIATAPRIGPSKSDLSGTTVSDRAYDVEGTTTEQRQAAFREKINKEIKIKVGSENLLEALVTKHAKQTKEQRVKVETELSSSNRKIAELKSQLEHEIEMSKRPSTPTRVQLSGFFQGSPLRSPAREKPDTLTLNPPEQDLEAESPSFVLAEILQALEVEGMQPDYYVGQANSLVDLFKRYPAIKYDLAWPIFGLRVQTMLLSASREVIAAGYRVTRHAIADRKSIQIVRGLNIDELVIVSLVKDGKASIEREQALKFVRAFLSVKNGVREISNAVMRVIVSVAEHHEDRLRSIAILTISEILVKIPPLVVFAGGIGPIADALADGTYQGSESLASAFLYLLDMPAQRKFLQSGRELDSVFTSFTDPLSVHGNEQKLKSSAQTITAILTTWPGLFALSNGDFRAIKSLLVSVLQAAPLERNLILDLLFEVLHIKLPIWASSYLAGRRINTYGRGSSLKVHAAINSSENEDDSRRVNLVGHFTTLLLAILIHCGVLKTLSDLLEDEMDGMLGKKIILLLGEIMKLTNQYLPDALGARLQVLPKVFGSTLNEDPETSSQATDMVYQIEYLNRNLIRSDLNVSEIFSESCWNQKDPVEAPRSLPSKARLSVDLDDIQFRSLLLETQVLGSSNYLKWDWDLINDLIEGPLVNPKRLDEVMKASKFLKRLFCFYRPFKYRFSDARNDKVNQRYVRTGCALIKTLLQSAEGIRYLGESKILRQLAECLAQTDRMSGLVSNDPLFTPYGISETLRGGYFTLLGVLSSDPQGLLIIERWHMVNMFYHILDLDSRPDLVEVLLSNMDFTLDSHLRVMLSKALTASPKAIRIYSTKLLRKYATRSPLATGGGTPNPECSEWAIRLLITQLYDPQVEVCEKAVQILEEACNQKGLLEYVVRCRPALDHLGEIGAPLLLRFLSTSIGYQYLDGLDYITQEMDDWFLGRNENYVILVEASLSQTFSSQPERPKSRFDEESQLREYGEIPPHFYRELTRTVEGCKLLRDSGHFTDFVTTIEDLWAEHEDFETITKLKGCLWAVGNIGSMQLGAPFLEETDVVTLIIKIAVSSEVMTLRGTAFFVLGLISRSLHGTEILAERGWTGATDQLGYSLGYCLPPQLGDLFSTSLRADDSTRKTASNTTSTPKDALTDEDPIKARILSLVIDLGNTVLTNRAAGDLYSIKAKKPAYFNSVPLFRKVMAILESHSYRLLVRRRVIDMFDKSVMRRIVLDDESDEELDREQGPT